MILSLVRQRRRREWWWIPIRSQHECVSVNYAPVANPNQGCAGRNELIVFSSCYAHSRLFFRKRLQPNSARLLNELSISFASVSSGRIVFVKMLSIQSWLLRLATRLDWQTRWTTKEKKPTTSRRKSQLWLAQNRKPHWQFNVSLHWSNWRVFWLSRWRLLATLLIHRAKAEIEFWKHVLSTRTSGARKSI